MPDKKWEGYYNANPNNIFQSEFRSTSKLIGGINYYELTYKVDGGWFEGVKQYYREVDDKVYRLYQGEEKLIFDFGMEVGDTIAITDDFGARFEFFPIRTTDTLIYNNSLRKLELRVKPENEPVSSVPHVWIEGVGDTGYFFGNGSVFGFQNVSPVYCVRENGFFFSEGMECERLSTTTNSTPDEVVDFIYDRSKRMVFVKNEEVTRLDLYTISGERMISYSIDENNTEIDLSMLNQRLCVVVLFDGKSYDSKILKL